MSPRVGDRIHVGPESGGEPTEMLVVGHDKRGNAETAPLDVLDNLEKRLGLQRAAQVRSALQTRAQVLVEVA